VYSLLCRKIGITPFGEKQAYTTAVAAEDEPLGAAPQENGGNNATAGAGETAVAGVPSPGGKRRWAASSLCLFASLACTPVIQAPPFCRVYSH